MLRNVEVESHRRVSRKGRVSQIKGYRYQRAENFVSRNQQASPDYRGEYYENFYPYYNQPYEVDRYAEPEEETRSGNPLATVAKVGLGLGAVAAVGLGAGMLWRKTRNAGKGTQEATKDAVKNVTETIFNPGSGRANAPTRKAADIVKAAVAPDSAPTRTPPPPRQDPGLITSPPATPTKSADSVRIQKPHPSIRSEVVGGSVYRPKVRPLPENMPPNVRRTAADRKGSRYIELDAEYEPTSTGVIPAVQQRRVKTALEDNDLVTTSDRGLYQRAAGIRRTSAAAGRLPSGRFDPETQRYRVSGSGMLSASALQNQNLPLQLPAKRALREGFVQQRQRLLSTPVSRMPDDVKRAIGVMDEVSFRPKLQEALGVQAVDRMLRNPIKANADITKEIKQKAEVLTDNLLAANPQLRDKRDVVYRQVLDLAHGRSVHDRLLRLKDTRKQASLRLWGDVMDSGLVHRRGYLLALRNQFRRYNGYDETAFRELENLNMARSVLKQRTKLLSELLRDPKYGREIWFNKSYLIAANAHSDGITTNPFSPSGRAAYYVGKDNAYTDSGRVRPDIATTSPPANPVRLGKSSRNPTMFEIPVPDKTLMRDKYGRRLLRSEAFGVTTSYAAPEVSIFSKG